jgi:isocitrate dehydrogenase
MYTEWDLIKESEDISKGDSIIVESTETGKTTSMVFIKEDDKYVYLKKKNTIFKFYKESLEDLGENFLMVGKHE